MNRIRVSVLVLCAALASLTPPLVSIGGGEVADPRVELSGRFVDCEQAASGVVVELVEPGPQQKLVRRTRSDEHGFFELKAPGPGVWTLVVRSSGAVLQRTVAMSTATVLAPIVQPDCSKEMPPGWQPAETAPSTAKTPMAVISGRVITIAPGEAGVPVEGAWVWTDGPSVSVTRSRVDGSYRLGVPTRRPFRLSAAGNGFFPAALPVQVARDVSEDRGPSFSLYPAAYIRGRVVAGELPGATRLELKPIRRPEWSPEVYSPPHPEPAYASPSGSFVLLAAPNTTYELTASQDGFTPATVEVRSGARGEPTDLTTIHLKRAVTVSGRLADQSGLPVAGARITLIPENEQTRALALLAGRTVQADYPTTKSTTEGIFEITPVPAGRHVLVVLADGFEPSILPGVAVSPDMPIQELDTVYLEPAARLDGVVRDPDGRPIGGAQVAVSLLATDGRSAAGRPGEAAVTDEDGRFEVGGLARGRKVNLSVRKEGFVPRVVPGQEVPQENEVRVTLELAGEVFGRVVDEIGNPVEWALVRVQPEAADGSAVRRSQTLGATDLSVLTNAKGRFHVGGIEPGTVEILASADCCRPTFQRHQVEPGVAESVIEIVLRPGASIEGIVLDPGHRPLPGVLVSADGRSNHTATDGRFRLTGLDTGTVALHAWHPDFGSVRRTADPAADEPVEIVYAAPAVLGLEFEDGLGRPVGGVRVFIGNPEPQHPRPLTTSSGGTLETLLQPGTYRVTATHPEFLPPPERNVSVESGEERLLTVALDRGAMLSGRILGPSPRELTRATVSAASGRRSRTGEINLEGRYRIAGLEPGLWMISASLSDGRRAEAAVEIADGRRETEVDIEFGRGAALRGTVVVDGEPLAAAWLTISTLHGTALARTATDAAGRFEVSGLTSQRVQMDLSTPAGDIRVSRTVNLLTATALEVHLWTGQLSGTVRAAATGVPIRNARITLAPLGDSTLLGRRSSTRPDGRFGAVRMPEGTYRATVSAPGYAEATTDITLRRDSELVVGFELVEAKPGRGAVTHDP